MAQPAQEFFSVVRVKGLKPRVDVFTKKLHANMTQLWNDATRAFIAEIINNDLIRIETGMSRSSLIPLGRVVKMVTQIKAFNTKQPTRLKNGGTSRQHTGYTDMQGDWHNSPDRSRELGEKMGKKAFRLNYGSPARPVFRFVFNINVYQYSLYEPELQSLARGQEAFLAYLKSNAMNYVPKLADWILPETQG